MMDWEELLIKLYFEISELYLEELQWHCQRYSNNRKWQKDRISDEEVLTIYLFGILRHRRNVKEIFEYANDHLRSWFPSLPSYQKFNERLNRMQHALCQLSMILMHRIELPRELVASQQQIDAVIDSMPIILAKGQRSDGAKVARGLANKGRCASKNLYYHGLKLHHLGLCCPKKMPLPIYFYISSASANDSRIFKEYIAPNFRHLRVYGDKIYHEPEAMNWLKMDYDIELMPCQKRKIGQEYLKADQKYWNTMISQARQPVESFFNWIEEKTAIQIASKVRSTAGLFKHIFGKLAAALFSLIF